MEHLAVAVMRTGNKEEVGKTSELFLDWSNVPLRLPDDVLFLIHRCPLLIPKFLQRIRTNRTCF
jgi:hypothetical protein